MDSFPDSEAVANALALVLKAHRRWRTNEPGGVRLNLTGACMTGANMSNANMAGASMAGASMVGSCMTGANMSAANMVGACMADVNLSDAYMRNANLSDAYIRDANMVGASMAGASMAGATLPHGIVRITAPESEAEPEPAPAPAERRRIEWFKRYDNRNGTQTLYARDQDGRVWWLAPFDPSTWTEVTPLPTYQEQP